MMKSLYFLVLVLFSGYGLFAQDVDRRGQKNGRFYGKVVEPASNKGIEAVSVQLFLAKNDSLVGGMLTKPNGDFSLGNLSSVESFRLVITAIGFKEKQLSITFNKDQQEKDLGNIRVELEAESLSSVTVVGTKPALQMGIDRKIFTADKSLTAAGGTAIDLMKNIPSVTVDVDGNVQLRNASPQIFVDGRPTILTLEQIPADNIERVELITNPSAKFDAASGGGIINVVLKKNKRLGLNGIVSAGAGSPNVLNSNLTLNLREGKFNVFASGSYNQSGGRTKGQTYRQNKQAGIVQDYFDQFSKSERRRRFTSVRFGFDYFIDNRNTLTLTQNFVKGKFSNNEHQDQQYYDINKIPSRYGDRESAGASQFNRSNTQLIYKHTFSKPGKEFSTDISYNTGGGKDGSGIINNYFNNDGTQYSQPNRVDNSGKNNNNQLTIQADYVNPISETSKWEMGVRSFLNDYTSQFNAFSVSPGGVSTKLPLSNNYSYTQLVTAMYATYSGAFEGFKYQVGLRAEHSKFDGELVDSARKFGYEYPSQVKNIWDALFPSVFLTKEVGDGHELQVNYTRRIRRPDFWQLNPFVDINDPVNLRQGNPELRPEFVNSFEFNYNYTYTGGSFLGVLYYRNNPADITQYSDTISAAKYQQLNNAAVDPNAILNTFINAQSNNRFGAEFTLQQKFTENFDITPTIDLQYRKVNAVIGDLDLSNEGFNWEAKLTANYKIITKNPSVFNKLGFQLMGEYESPEIIPQGRNKAQYSVDFAMRKEFLKNDKAAVTFAINDVFNSRRFGTIYDTDNFYQDSYRRWNVRSFRVTFSYKFGSSEFSLFKKNDDDNGGGQDTGG